MNRKWNKDKNVYQASMERMDFIFKNFERVYLSFSGGKDSGVMLNLALTYMRENPDVVRGRKLGIQVMDNEANYEYSVEFMQRMIENNRDMLDVFWCCLPITLPCTVSAYHIDWQCWGNRDRDRWIRPMYDKDYITKWENHPFPFFKEDMHYDEFWDGFAEWYSQGKSCANMIGIRTQESLNRFRAIMNDRKETMHGQPWTKKNTAHTYNVYPIYDWKTEDIWTANARYEWDYNKLYGSFMMRVILEWPVSCENALTDYNINRRAWVGHAAAALAIGCPEHVTRKAWKHLSYEQQYLANEEASRAIRAWENNYLESKQLRERVGETLL